ncbi:MAG: hypothetical protein WCA34_05860, partial [Candidatus Acidiferrales bacterium]
ESFIQRARAQRADDVDILYKEACINAIIGKPSRALTLLQDALEKHYPAEYASADPDLDSLHNNPEFDSLIKKYSKKEP